MIRIGTYNTGDFSGDGVPAGSEQAKACFREVIEAEGVALWGLQEDVGFFNPQTEQTPYEAVYSGYKNYRRCGVKKYNYKAFLTDLPISQPEQVYYVGERKFHHPWFLHAQVQIEGRDVCVITLHFDWQDRATREMQIRQVIAFAAQYPYVMILGDFNPTNFVEYVQQSPLLIYDYDLDLFREAGFSVANIDKFGTFTTIVGRDPCYPCDNIVVSPNIKICKVGRIFRDWMNDHTALWADVELT